METSLFPGAASMASHGHLHGLPAPYLLAAAAAHHQHALNTSPPPATAHMAPPLGHPGASAHHHAHFPATSYHHAAASALTRLTSSENFSQSVSKSASHSVTALAASLAASQSQNAKYSIANLTAGTSSKNHESDFSRFHHNSRWAYLSEAECQLELANRNCWIKRYGKLANFFSSFFTEALSHKLRSRGCPTTQTAVHLLSKMTKYQT